MKQLLIFIFLCVGHFLSAQNSKQIQEAMNNYDYVKAIALIEKEVPTADLLFQKGKAFSGLGQPAEALKAFRQIITEDSLNQRACIEAAECCRQMAKYNTALAYYRKTIDINPDNKYARIQYISLLCNQQQYDEAFGESSMMAETDSSAIVLRLQAQSLEGKDDFIDAALGCYHVIQDKYPDDYLAAAKLGQIYIAMQEYDYAIEATEKYRECDTTNLLVNRQNAQAYCLAQNFPMAIKRYEYLVSQGDKSFQTCYYLGISYYATEKHYEAHDILEVARKYDPQNVNLLYYLGRSCSKTSWKKEGVRYLEDAITYATPQDSAMIRLYIGMTDCYKSAQMFKEQLETIKERYEKYDKQNHKLLYDMAFLYCYYLKSPQKAERCLEAFLKTRPSKPSEKPSEVDESGTLILDMNKYYNAAVSWLKDLKEKKKTEEFFQGKMKEKPAVIRLEANDSISRKE